MSATLTAPAWEAVSDPIDGSPPQPAQQPMGTAGGGHASALDPWDAVSAPIPANAPHAAVADPAANGIQDDSASAPETFTFNDQAPEQASSHMTPEDESAFFHLLKDPATKADDLRAFVARRGLQLDNADLILSNARKGHINTAVDYELPHAQSSVGGAAARGVARGGTFGFADELRGVTDAVKAWTQGKDFSTAYDHSVDQSRGQFASDDQQHNLAALAGELYGNLAIPAGLEKSGLLATSEAIGLKAGSAALREGATMQEARAIAARAITRRLAVENAAQGTALGAGNADGGPGDRLLGAVTGGAVGALGGAAIGKVAERIAPALRDLRANISAAPISEADQFTSAADRQGIDYLAADRPGALPSQWLSSLANLTLGGIPLTEAAQRVVGSAKAARNRIAAGAGFVTDNHGAGEAVQKGAQYFINSSERKGSALYDAIPIAGEKPAVLTNSVSALRDLKFSGMESNPELGALVSDARLKSYQAALEGKTESVPTGLLDANGSPIMKAIQKGGQLSWQDLKAFRSYVGELAGRPTLQDNTSQAALKRLYGGLSDDMQQTAAQNGPKAVSAFNRANQFWRGRQDRIENVLTAVLGKDYQASPESAFNRIQAWSHAQTGDAVRLTRLLRSLPDDDANSVRASLIERLGQAPKGQQDQTGMVFSPAVFMKHWNGMSDRAKTILFQGELRSALNDLATVASGMKASTKFANSSKTGIAAIASSHTIPLSMSNPLLGAMSAMSQYGAGKLLGSPKFARWLAAYAQKPNPSAALAHIDRLGVVARAEPTIANNVLQLQQHLASAFMDAMPTKIAANEPAHGALDVQPKQGAADQQPE